MAIGHWLRAWQRTHGSDRRAHPVRRSTPFRPLETLEDRSVPAVTVVQDPLSGIVTVSASAANDAISIAGTNFNGDALLVAGTGLANPIAVSGATALVVNDTSGSATANGQQVTFLDQINGTIILSPVFITPTQTIPGTGRLDVTGLETVNFFSQRRPLIAESGIAVAQADAVTVRENAYDWGLYTSDAPISISATSSIALNAVLRPGAGDVVPLIRQVTPKLQLQQLLQFSIPASTIRPGTGNITLTTGGTITDGFVANPANTPPSPLGTFTPVDRNAVFTAGTVSLIGTGASDAAGTATAPLTIGAANLIIDTSAQSASVFISLDPLDIKTTLQTGSINMGTGTLHLIAAEPLTPTSPPAVSSLYMAGANVFNDAITIDLALNTNLDVILSDTIGRLTGVGTVTTTDTVGGTLIVGGNNLSSTFDGQIVDGVLGGVLSFAKVGTGTFTITTGTNTYSGGTVLRDGTLKFLTSGAYGSAGVVIGDALTPAGASLTLSALPNNTTFSFTNPITVNRPNAIIGSDDEGAATLSRVDYTGGVALNLARDQQVRLHSGFRNGTTIGSFSGTGNLNFITTTPGRLILLSGGSSFTNPAAVAGNPATPGQIYIQDGVGLFLQGGTFTHSFPLRPDFHFVAVDSRLLINPGTTFIGSVISDTPGAGQIQGSATPGLRTLVIGANDSSATYSGDVSEFAPSFSFQKTGLGTQHMSGTIDISNVLSVFGGGQLYLDGSVTASRVVAEGVGSYLGGLATFNSPIWIYNSGSLRPGDASTYQAITPSTLLFGPSAAFPNPSELAIKLDNSTTFGLRHDSVAATGLVDITGATLLVIPGAGLGSNPIPAGTVITLVESPVPIMGEFAGLPNNSTIQPIPGGQLFLLRYQTNQITLTAVLPPGAALSAPNVTNANQPNPYLFTVTYDSALGIDASTFGNGNVTITLPNSTVVNATFVSATPPGNGSPLAATYSILPPGGSWDPSDTGTYTVKAGANPVADTLGLKVATGVTFGTFDASLIPDVAAPTNTLSAPNVTTAIAPNPYFFTVDFADATAVDAATFADGNFTITAPDSSVTPVTFVSATPPGNGSPITVTYSFVPPGGAWAPSNIGNYVILVGANPVADTVGNAQTTGAPVGVFNSTFGDDGLPPTGVVTAPTVTISSNPNSYTFTVTYTDPIGFNPATFATNNVVVTGPNGFSAVPVLTTHTITGSTASANYTFTPPGGAWDRSDNGTYTVKVGTSPVADAVNTTMVPDTDIGTFDVNLPFSTAHGPRIAVGGQSNGSALILDPNASGVYSATATVAPLSFFTGTVRTAAADVNGDGFIDTIAISGPGVPTRFGVISGHDNRTVLIGPTAPFAGSEGFSGGGFVAAGDLDGDGRAEMAFTPDQGGGARVVIFSLPGNQVFLRKNFLGIDDPNFRGGARPAMGDVNRDGIPDLAVSAGFLGGPRTALFDGASLAGTPTRMIGDFFAFPGEDAATLRNGVYVSIGDINGDGYGDLIFGGGPGGAPRVYILSGVQVAANDVAGAQANPIANFFVDGNENDRSGVRVSTANADGDLKADLVIGSGQNAPARVQIYLGKNFTGFGEPSSPQVLDLFNSAALADGVYVG